MVFLIYLTVAAALPWWIWPAIAASFAVPVARFFGHRAARADLLVAAHTPLAPHEQGEDDLEGSAFRAAPRLPPANPSKSR